MRLILIVCAVFTQLTVTVALARDTVLVFAQPA